jgi:indole-3-glycerol phosphate synthase
VAERKKVLPLEALQERVSGTRSVRDFAASIRRETGGLIRVIAEVKKASPSKGIIRTDMDPVDIARQYAAAGASAISVLTEEDFFQGHPSYLTRIGEAVALPLLRKDFILEPYQVVEARVLGADAFLLIVSLLDDARLEALIGLGRDLGMTALVEVHTAEELARAVASPAEVIGINNRNLKTFVTDLHTTLALVGGISSDRVVVSESGIREPRDMARLADRVDAVLVGEALMRAPDPGEKLRELLDYRSVR